MDGLCCRHFVTPSSATRSYNTSCNVRHLCCSRIITRKLDGKGLFASPETSQQIKHPCRAPPTELVQGEDLPDQQQSLARDFKFGRCEQFIPLIQSTGTTSPILALYDYPLLLFEIHHRIGYTLGTVGDSLVPISTSSTCWLNPQLEYLIPHRHSRQRGCVGEACHSSWWSQCTKQIQHWS